MKAKHEIKLIPIDKITVLNPRDRSQKSFNALKENIKTVGLKKPVTVRPSDDSDGYELVCGEGRLNSYIENGEEMIPAIIREDLSQEDAYVMSLVENMARRQHTAMDLMKGIELLKSQGYGVMDITRKTGLTDSYVSGILTLLNQGEERLLSAVEAGHVPLSNAIKIASSPDQEQEALQELYEGGLRGKGFLMTQKLVEKRRNLGKGMRGGGIRKNKSGENLSAHQMMQHFKTEVDRMRSLIEKANVTENTLMVVVEAFYNLMKDENFKTLLRAEDLNTMPETLSEMIKQREVKHV